MASLLEVRTRIATVTTTKQITSAMKLVSSTKLFKNQRTLNNLKPFTASLFNMVKDIYRNLHADEAHKITLPAKGNKVLIVTVGSNKGLCGTYNVMLIRKTLNHIQILEKSGLEVHLLFVGSKIADFFLKNEIRVHSIQNDIIENVNYDTCSELANKLIALYIDESYSRIDFVYSKFRHALIQEFVAEQLLPLTSLPKPLQEPKTPDDFNQEDIFKVILEPDRKEISDYLIPKYFRTLLFQLFLNAAASEHGARMAAMQKSTDNATELLKALSLTMNKVRQSMITREIMEIVSGAESMKQ
ncbi:MAG TPA: ATP synthase F1 subunit gamma [Bacteroidales bacterium]|nr:ATP synthase F1 subunit gamma [Bacteroidales bacterium]